LEKASLGSIFTDSNQKNHNLMKKVIFTEKAPAAIGPYSQAILANDTLYMSGQIALDLAPLNDIPAETKKILENIGHFG
jgi:2-iminobutanoate/2-iminopropanoate deaminase